MNIYGKLLMIFPAVLCLWAFQLGCDDTDLEDEDAGVSEEVLGLHQYGATLTVKLSVQSWNNANPSICLGRSDRCLVLDTSSACTTTGTTRQCTFVWTNTGDLTQDDKPFVNEPDDWDKQYILNNSSSSSLKVTGVKVSLHSGSFTYDFVDNFALSKTLSANAQYSVDSLIREKREAHILSFTNAFSSFDEMPSMMKEAAYDIGQMGIVKYRPWDSSTQNGCDEFFNYFASQYSNNIYFSCDDAHIAECSYYRNWGNGYNGLSTDQFFYAGRLYKFVFNADVSRYTIQKCLNVGCTSTDSSQTYAIKAGDFYRKAENGGSWHVMMSLGEAPSLTISSANYSRLSVPVIDKNELVTVRDRVFSLPRNNPAYLELLVGEVDNELGGGRTDAEAFNAGYRTTQQTILN